MGRRREAAVRGFPLVAKLAGTKHNKFALELGWSAALGRQFNAVPCHEVHQMATTRPRLDYG